MEYTSYQIVSENTSSLNTGSYINSTEYSMFVDQFSPDLWYGVSDRDAIELGVWDRDKKLLGWKTIYSNKEYAPITLNYIDHLDFPVTYSYNELKPDFILYKNEKILINPIEQVSSSFEILSGSYILTYNFIREMAGTEESPLVIKDISPSRKEIKLIPLETASLAYNAYCQKKILVKDVSSLYINSIKNCPYGEIYNKISSVHPTEINIIRKIFFLTSENATIEFFRNLYEDQWIYNSSLESAVNINLKSDIIRIQGIRTYFTNFLLQNTEKIIEFKEIDSYFEGFVSASIERKFLPIGPNPIQPYIDAKKFVFDFFTKYFYTSISNKLTEEYNKKYYFPLKNALNLGKNRFLPILNSGYIDEKVDSDDPLTLIVKLQDELPTDIHIQSHCWVTNISLVPYIVSAIIKHSKLEDTYKIGPPNFSISDANASLTNTNLKYSEEDLREEEEISRELTISKNIQELSVDYTDFKNFVVFSSAEMRLKIFKNKMINISDLNSAMEILNKKNHEFIISSGSNYPHYEHEHKNIQSQLDECVNTFDGYESYLYRGGGFEYKNRNFISSSYIKELESTAISYDKLNRDSFIHNCPEHILIDSENDEYIIFLSMIGHFFDNIYIYIANLPSEKKIKNSETEEFTRRVTDYMLQAFGWDVDDTLEQTTILNNYLSIDELEGLNKLSSEERLKIIRNRILVNLPQIYKTKGTEEAIKIILSCYGIPSSLLSVREYGGINYSTENASYTTYERVYLRQWNAESPADTYYLSNPAGMHTCLFKFCVDDAKSYAYNKEHILVGGFTDLNIQKTEISASGNWAAGIIRVPKKNGGKVFFRIGLNDSPILTLYSSEFPLFNGSIYSVMLRRNPPADGFEYTENSLPIPSKFDLYVQQNDGGNRVLHLTSSGICYNTASNLWFSGEGEIRIGGWFSHWNQRGYTGCFDKLQTWFTSLTDADFENYVNNINSYAFSGPNSHKNLIFRMHYDYPIDQRQELVNSEWTGKWKNANPYFSNNSNKQLECLYGIHDINVDYMVNSGSWVGVQELIPDKCSPTGYVSQSCYPWQFKVIDYPNTWNVSKYGPNKFRNEKINYASQSVEARLDHLDRSTYTLDYNNAPDSNQVGFFVDPQDFKNRDIVRYLGNFDLMDSIGDPQNRFQPEYLTLKSLRKEYADAHIPASGSKTLFNELLILYKLYFNQSIFEAIKNVIPARANPIVGVLIEPTILERPKYYSKKILSEINTGSTMYLENSMSRYFRDKKSLVTISASNSELEHSTNIFASYVSLPLRDYPANFGGNYISDFSDPYNIGHFAGGILTMEELRSLRLLPIVNFKGNPLRGVAPLSVQFTSICFNVTSYEWEFGDEDKYIHVINPPYEALKNEEHPLYTYEYEGIYSVSLIGYNGEVNLGLSATRTEEQYIIVSRPEINVSFAAIPRTGSAGETIFRFENYSNSNSSAELNYIWDFGDGKTSNDKEPLHVYENEGIYTVTLTATAGNYSESLTEPEYILVEVRSEPCGGTFSVNGGHISWNDTPNYYEYVVGMGTPTGLVTMEFDTYKVPDKMVVIWDGQEVINTGWRGIEGPENKTTYIDDIRTATGDGSINVSGPAKGSATFVKNKRLPMHAILRVWGPRPGTAWRIRIGCPDNPPAPF